MRKLVELRFDGSSDARMSVSDRNREVAAEQE
jgi:hypothetical protein